MPVFVHDFRLRHVTSNVTSRLLWVFLALAPVWAADLDVSKLLKSVEDRYNNIQTLQTSFEETMVNQGRRRTESGELFLRKPGRMRWQYSSPAGKLFLSDGKNVYFYSPDTNRAEKMKLKETEDMRAPMAFLLGRIEFQKDFKEFRSKPEPDGVLITAIPKSDKMPYREVSFLVGPDSRIERLVVTGQDASVLEFTFQHEKLNPKVADSLFRFELPKGAEFVDSSEAQGAQ
jgi:outer membrane lipoprotein carrier protein